jgi:hypothetical protein
LALVTNRYTSPLFTVTLGVNTKWQTARQAIENLPHIAKDKAILLHVALAHVLWQSSASRLLVDKVADTLNPIPNRQWFMLEKMRSFFTLLN